MTIYHPMNEPDHPEGYCEPGHPSGPPLAPDGPTRAPDMTLREKVKQFMDRCRLLGAIPEMTALAWDLCVENEGLEAEVARLRACLPDTPQWQPLTIWQPSAPPPVAGQEPPPSVCRHCGAVRVQHGPEEQCDSSGNTSPVFEEVAALAPSRHAGTCRRELLRQADDSAAYLSEPCSCGARAPSPEPGVSVIPIPREALARNPFEYLTSPPHMPTDRQQTEQLVALAPSPAALEAEALFMLKALVSLHDDPCPYDTNTTFAMARNLIAKLEGRALSPASAPPREPSHCEGDHHVWSDRFGDDWTPDVGTPCDCRAKRWGAPQ